MIVKPIKVTPMEIRPMSLFGEERERDLQHPLGHKPLSPMSETLVRQEVTRDVNMKQGGLGLFPPGIGSRRAENLPDSSNLPRCSIDQERQYERNWEKILNPRVKRHMEKSKDVLHGGRSLNYLLADNNPESDLYRESKDWDMFSNSPKKVAQRMEKEIDKTMGCNICDVVHVPIPDTTGRQYDDNSADLYRITTAATRYDAEIDIMESPKSLPTVRHMNMNHESLEQQHTKTRRGLMQPMRSFKSGLDKTRIEEYWRRHGQGKFKNKR